MKSLLECISARVACARARAHSRVGDRTYRVFLVLRKYSEEPGRGGFVEKRFELGCGKVGNKIVPPDVQEDEALLSTYLVSEAGTYEQGTVLVRDISDSLILDEETLSTFGQLAQNESSHYEIQEDGGPVRRYQLQGAPFHKAASCSWHIILRPLPGMGAPYG